MKVTYITKSGAMMQVEMSDIKQQGSIQYATITFPAIEGVRDEMKMDFTTEMLRSRIVRPGDSNVVMTAEEFVGLEPTVEQPSPEPSVTDA